MADEVIGLELNVNLIRRVMAIGFSQFRLLRTKHNVLIILSRKLFNSNVFTFFWSSRS